MTESGDNGKEVGKPSFFVIKGGEGKLPAQSPGVEGQVEILSQWLLKNKKKLHGVCICYEFRTDSKDAEAIGMKTTEMRYRDIQYMLFDGLARMWATTRGVK